MSVARAPCQNIDAAQALFSGFGQGINRGKTGSRTVLLVPARPALGCPSRRVGGPWTRPQRRDARSDQVVGK